MENKQIKKQKQTIMQKLDKRFSNPALLSFKNIVESSFILFFFYVSFRALKNTQALEVMKEMKDVIMAIILSLLGGEGINAYFMSKNPNMYNNQMYGGYGNTGYDTYGNQGNMQNNAQYDINGNPIMNVPNNVQTQTTQQTTDSDQGN